MPKKRLNVDVFTAARERITRVFDDFERICVSFSGGKDSSVLLHLACEEARRRGRTIGVLIIDLEAQYKYTINHIYEMLDLYDDCLDVYWVCLPIKLRNAVSQFQPRWTCWNPDVEDDWVRPMPDHDGVVSDRDRWHWFEPGMEFEEFTPLFAEWYSTHEWDGDGVGALTASLVGIRSDESLNRFRALAMEKKSYDCLQWTTWKEGSVYSAYPIYDWRTEDIWRANGKEGWCYNELYDRMHEAGLSIHQQRICQPYGDDQRKGLWLYHLIEPETWSRIVARVNGANSGALYARESGNINGTIKVKRPPDKTWQEFAEFLLQSMPEKLAEHYRNKIAVFINFYLQRGYEHGIPDEAPVEKERSKDAPSWRRICKVLLRNDYWCKGLSFSPTKSDSYQKYKDLMDRRRRRWSDDLPDSIAK